MSKWVLESDNSVLLGCIKNDEGSIAYQKTVGYYKDGLFRIYKDHLGYPTIGYGHLILKGEDFTKGINESQADALLVRDLKTAVKDAKSIYEQFNMTGGMELQLVLAQMCFQMGKTKVLGFKKALAAMTAKNYVEAAKQMRDSSWYKQTPQRANRLSKIVESL